MSLYYGYQKGSPEAIAMMKIKEPLLWDKLYGTGATPQYLGNGVTSTVQQIIQAQSGIQVGTDLSILGNLPTANGGNTMQAGQDLTLYQKIDSEFGGYLPGGVAPGSTTINPFLATATKALGLTAGAALAVTGGIAAYNWLKKDGTLRKTKANGQPYKKPSMNYANPKALSRATRRLTSFKNHYAKQVKVLGYHISRSKA